MGLFRRNKTIDGTAQIVSCSAHRGEGRWQNCKMNLVVTVDGQAPYAAETHQIAPRKKWPQPGMVVPVEISADDPLKVKVKFDDIPSGEERARDLAAQQAAAMSGQPSGGEMPNSMPNIGAGSPGMPTQVNIIGDINEVPPEKLAKLEQMTGMDLDGDGIVGGAPRPATGSDDRLDQLERLAQLHSSGALSDEEFESEKRRLLG